MLRAAVFGCGSMGRNHVRVLTDLEGVELVAVADADPSRLGWVQRRYGIATYEDHVQLLRQVAIDCAIVAVPTMAHFAVVSDLVRAGIDTLVEKPIAATLEEAQALSVAARQYAVLLAVGHVEHFNPAIIELKRRLDEGELGRVFQANVRRLGPFPARVRDVGVVLDLATHDLDVLRFVLGSEAVRVFAETEQRIHTAHEDLMSGLVRFANGVVASLEINWLTPTKVRTLSLTGERGMFVVDYLLQDLYFYSNDYANSRWETLQAITGVSEGSMTRYKVDKQEPLRVEIQQFINAVADHHGKQHNAQGSSATIVTAADGVEALRLASLVVKSGQTGTVIDATLGRDEESA